MKRANKALCVFIALLLAVVIVPLGGLKAGAEGEPLVKELEVSEGVFITYTLDGNTLTVSGSADCAWGTSHSWIQDQISLVKAGPSTFALNGTNTYTGATTVQEGTLALNSAKALGGTTNVALTGGTILANASDAFNADGTLTVPDPANGTLSLADGTTQTVDWLVVGGIPQPSGAYTKVKAGSAPRLAFLARGEGSGTLFVRKGSGSTIIIR